jgi:hypothetical protein
MNCRLRTYSVNPPGNYIYHQHGDKPRKFGPEPLIQSLAQNMASYRTANNLPRASVQECLVDADRFTAQRLGCDRKWTVPVEGESNDVPMLASSVYVGGGCAGCGVQL